MPKLRMEVSHTLSQEEALKRIKGLLGEVKIQFADKVTDLNERWSGNEGTFSFSAMGFATSGTLLVSERKVVLEGSLPFAAALFKGRIEEAIRNRARTLLA